MKDIPGRFERRVVANMGKWGRQSIETLALAIAEEAGEIAQAVRQHQHEGGPWERIEKEAVDLGALCIQIINAVVEDRGR